MSISKKLDETLDNLDLTSAAQSARDSVISKSMKNLKEKMSGLDIQVERQKEAVAKEELKPRYEGTELADTARKVYRENVKPADKKDKVTGPSQPSTIASRANVSSIARALAGMRNGGDAGKTSFVGPNGVGNVGKSSPTGPDGVGNVSNTVGNYYALTTDMTLEQYEQYVQNIFEGEDCDCEEDKAEKTKKEIKARGGPPGYPDTSKKTTKEDVVHELEQRLITLGSTDWIVVDQVLREMAKDLDVAPLTLSREFRSVHGMYPDKWIKEHLELEICGFMPLDEAVRLNKVGKVYEVTFMFRGGTNRLKFFWPHPGDASKEQMQYEVEKFWPKGRVLAFYPTIDNEQNSNYMVMASPMTENFHFMDAEDWVEMNEEQNEIFNMICEEEGEPMSPPLIQDDGAISVIIEDHDDGEPREVMFSEKRGLWDNIHAKRKRGEKPAKKGDKDYPETLNIESLDQARKNVGASTCWDGYKAKGTKKKNGKDVPNCVKEEGVEQIDEISSDLAMKASRTAHEKGRIAARDGDSSKATEKRDQAKRMWRGGMDRKRKEMNEEEVCPVCGYDPCQCLEGNIQEGDEMKGMSQKSGDKRSTDSGAGMTAKGVAKYNARTGGNLKTAVTTPPSKLKAGSKAAGRRKSFCARSKSWNGERGKAARRRWNC